MVEEVLRVSLNSNPPTAIVLQGPHLVEQPRSGQMFKALFGPLGVIRQYLPTARGTALSLEN